MPSENFKKILRTKKDVNWERLSFSVGESFQNYMMHELLHLLEEISLPIQFHTGLQAGNGNNSQFEPSLSFRAVYTLPGVKFISLHMSFPFQQEAAAW
jgi:predicted TIM-barrel fold metal-dependent hydrolase